MNFIGEMNTRFLPALVLLFCAAILPAQVRHVITDKSPAELFVHGGNVHLLTAGVDRNFNGLFEPDSGDAPARWFVISPYTDLVTDSLTFEGFFNSYPIRFGVDADSSVLYVAQLGRVRSFDLNTRKLLRDTVALGAYTGVSFEPYSRSVICHMRTDFTSPGYVVAIQSQRGDTLGIFPAGLNPQMSLATYDGGTQGPAVYTLNEGTYTKPDASISYASGNNDIYKARNNRQLGGGASYLATRGTTAFVVLNGTHQIRMIDARQHTELPLSPINVGTSGFDGPRSLAFQTDEIILVPTYAGDLRRFITLTGKMYDSIPLPGKGESVAVHDSLAFVTIKYGLGGTGYDPDSMVAVVNLNTARVMDTIPVGLDPATLFFDKRGDLHVLGYGKDDTSHWWMVFDGTTLAQKSSRTLRGVFAQ
jgi:DNA-binding beta-propeller fold protein YncE